MKRGDPEWIELVQEERRAEVDRFNARRSIEWRLAVTLWGGFGLAANAVGDSDLEAWAQLAVSAMVVLVFVLHAVWVEKFMIKNSISNWRAGARLSNVIRSELGIEGDPRRDPNLWGYRWQVGITGILGGFVIVLALS